MVIPIATSLAVILLRPHRDLTAAWSRPGLALTRPRYQVGCVVARYGCRELVKSCTRRGRGDVRRSRFDLALGQTGIICAGRAVGFATSLSGTVAI